jgi:rhamnosyltransferase
VRFASHSTYCIIVSYQFDYLQLLQTVESIANNSVKMILVDNGSSNQDTLLEFKELYPTIELLLLKDNVGIAKAQNIGIESALRQNAEFIWLSDQDTLYQVNYLQKMFDSLKLLRNEELMHVGAIGPTFIDTTRDELQPIVKFAPFTKKFKALQGLNEVSHIISSGMLIPANNFHIVGLKNSDLFIDWVDMDWCWRASNMYKFKIYVNGDVTIAHKLGDSYVRLLGKKIIVRSPFRHYFMVRNALSLAIYSSSMLFLPRVELITKAIIWTVLFPIIAPNHKFEHFKAVTKGMFDGVFNILGAKNKAVANA